MGAAMAVESAAQFARSMLLTRQLGVTEFGIAAAMVTLLTLIEMSTYGGADRYLVQARDGDTGEALAVAHTLTVVRNILCAALLALFAYPTARLLGVPQAAGSFMWLAIIPLLRSFEHLRLEQLQRKHRFGPWASASAATNLIGLVAVAVAAAMLRDHRAVLWGLGTQAVALVVSTHVVAGVPYRLSFGAAPVARAARFGMPLMLNGLALAVLGQFDRLAVGTFLGVGQLGRYGLATMIFYVPAALLMRVMITVLQPRLSAAWHRSPLWEFPNMFRQINGGVARIAALAGAAAAIIGSPLLALLFGSAYAVGDSFFAFFSLGVFFRFARTSVNFGGMAMGRTMDMMLSNVPIAFGLLVTIAGLKLAPSLTVAAIGSLVAELVGAIAAFALIRRGLNVSGSTPYGPFVMALPLPCGAAIWTVLASPGLPLRVAVVVVLAASMAASAMLMHYRARQPVTD